MPGVVYLPGDTRWGDIGKGIGGLAGNVAQGYLQAQVNSGVADIMNDPALAGNAQGQLAAVTKKYGAEGIKSLTQQLDSRVKIGQLGLVGAETGEATAKTAQTLNAIDIAKGQAPATLAETIARAKALGTDTAFKQAQLDAGLPAAQATTEIARGGLLGAQEGEANMNMDLIHQSIENMKTLMAPANPGTAANGQPAATNLDNMMTQRGITDPQDRARVQNAALTNPKNPLAAVNAEMDKIQDRNARVNQQDALPTDVRKTVSDAATLTTNLEPFMSASPEATGFTGGIKGWFAKKLGVGSPDIMAELTAGEQAMANFAQSGTGFGGAWRVALGTEAMPSIQHTPLYNVLLSGQIASQQLAKLQQAYKAMEPIPKYKDSLPQIQEQIDKWAQIKGESNGLWWGYDQNTPDGMHGSGKLHVYYKGQEVDQKTLQPLATAQQTTVAPDTTIKAKDGKTYKGADITEAARRAGVTPAAMLQLIQGQ